MSVFDVWNEIVPACAALLPLDIAYGAFPVDGVVSFIFEERRSYIFTVNGIFAIFGWWVQLSKVKERVESCYIYINEIYNLF